MLAQFSWSMVTLDALALAAQIGDSSISGADQLADCFVHFIRHPDLGPLDGPQQLGQLDRRAIRLGSPALRGIREGAITSHR